VTHPPSSGPEQSGQADPQQPSDPYRHGPDQAGGAPDGWQTPAPEPTQQYEPTQQFQQPDSTQPLYPQAGQQPPMQAYPGQPYPGWDQNAQQPPGQYPYGQPGQPGYTYPYGGYGSPAPKQNGSRNAMIAITITLALLAGGFSAYWFGFHSTGPAPAQTPAGLGSTLAASASDAADTGNPDDVGSSAAAPSSTDTSGAQITALEALMATMTDQGCKSAFQAIITFEQAAARDAGDDTALINDYDTAIGSLSAAQGESQNTDAAAAIGQVVTDWKAYTAALAGGGSPSDSAMTSDGQQLAEACLAS
jgi:flagellar basal body-associated protein FliL